MKTQSRLALSILALAVVSLACNLELQPPATAQPLPPVDALEQPPATQPPPQDAQPSQPPPSPVADLPAGFATANEATITFYGANGAQISQLTLPQSTYVDRYRVHIAGNVPASGQVVPLLYLSYADGEALLYRDGVGQIFSLLNTTGLLGLTGAPGQPIVAFSQIDYLENMNLRSNIYAGSVQTLPSAAPVSVIDDPESWAIKPLMVEAEDGVPSKVWYTRIAYGIGGDIVFEPRKGLFVLDLATGQSRTVLDNAVAPWSISVDKNWYAYSNAGFQEGPMCVKNVQTGAELCYPALPASESRGAGEAFISPDAQYVAWMEGEGWQMAEVPSFTATVRVGQNNGAIVADLPMNTFEDAAGIGRIGRADPVAWLDNQTLIIQARSSEQWDKVSLLRYNVINRETSYLASGEFIGLLYP